MCMENMLTLNRITNFNVKFVPSSLEIPFHFNYLKLALHLEFFWALKQ